MKKLALLLMIVGVACWMSTTVQGGIPHTKYGCASCHVPHHATPENDREYGVPLWAPRVGTDALMDDGIGGEGPLGNLHLTGGYTLYQPIVSTNSRS